MATGVTIDLSTFRYEFDSLLRGSIKTGKLYVNELGSRVHSYIGYAQPWNGNTKLVAEESSQRIVSMTTVSSEVRTMRRFCARHTLLPSLGAA